MSVYHGTTLEIYKMIKSERVIKSADQVNSPYSCIGDRKTTDGYVYVTSIIKGVNGAIDYASRNFRQRMQNSGRIKEMNNSPVEIVVIRLEIDDRFLEKDMDDEFVDTSYRFKGNLYLTNETAVGFRFPNYQKCCDFYDNLTAEKIADFKWKKILSE